MSPELQAALAAFLTAALGLLGVVLNILAFKLSTFVDAKKAAAKAALGATQYALLVDAIRMAVNEAEQLGAKQGLTDKMGLVLQRGLAFANSHNIGITADEVKGIAEALLNQGAEKTTGQLLSGIATPLLTPDPVAKSGAIVAKP